MIPAYIIVETSYDTILSQYFTHDAILLQFLMFCNIPRIAITTKLWSQSAISLLDGVKSAITCNLCVIHD